MDRPQLRFLDIIEALVRHDVEFIVVGGVAAVIEGAPLSTFDLDIMHHHSEENHGYLLGALKELNARYRDPAGRHIVPDMAKLESYRVHRLLTDSGPLDILTEIDPNLGYPELLERTVIHEVAGLKVRCLQLEVIIYSKECAGREKDRASLPVLRRTLKLKSQLNQDVQEQ